MDPGPTKIENVIYLDYFEGDSQILGTLHLSVDYILFISDTPNAKKHEYWLKKCLISSVVKVKNTLKGLSKLVIKSKNFKVFSFVIEKEKELDDIYQSLLQHTLPKSFNNLPCFKTKRTSHDNESLEEISLAEEYRSMGLPSDKWKLCELNTNYKLCDSYPEQLYVPECSLDSTIMGSANFRSKRRFPVLTYLHPNMSSSLCRCSQPNVGLNGKSIDDQVLFEQINSVNTEKCLNGKLSVVDSRPQINAITNRALGKGHEDETIYKNIHFQFFNIENIHVVRKDFERFLETIQNENISLADYGQSVDKSNWFKHLRLILDASYYVAHTLESGNSVIVHCSDGWDRTSQVVSLAQVILDPRYRTLTGFLSLIEKDWVSFGYKFLDRSGLVSSTDPKDTSPIFMQWLECVHHLLTHCPDKFQFNDDLLIAINDAYYSASFGNFIYNSEKARKDLNLKDKTACLWSKILKNRESYLNPYYDCVVKYKILPDSKITRPFTDLLQKNVLRPQFFQLWKSLYLRQAWRLTPSSKVLENNMRNWLSAINYSHDYINHLLVKIYRECQRKGLPFEQYVNLDQIIAQCSPPEPKLTSKSSDSLSLCELTTGIKLASSTLLSDGENLDESKNESDTEDDDDEEDFVMELLENVSKRLLDVDFERRETNLEFKKIYLLKDIERRAQLTPDSGEMVNTYPKDWQMTVVSTSVCPGFSCGVMLGLSYRKGYCHACGKVFCKRCLKLVNDYKYCYTCRDNMSPAHQYRENDSSLINL